MYRSDVKNPTVYISAVATLMCATTVSLCENASERFNAGLPDSPVMRTKSTRLCVCVCLVTIVVADWVG